MKRISLLISIILVVSLVAVGFAGCSSPAPTTTDSQADTPASEQVASSEAAPAEESVEIPLILMGRFTEFLIAMEDGAAAKAEELGVQFSAIDGQSDNEVQVNAVNDMIGKGVNAIIINPIDSEGIVSAVLAANQAGIPVVSADSTAADGEIASAIGFDNYQAGVIAAQYLISLLPEDKTGKILEVQGPLGAYHAIKRHEGFAEEIAKYPGLELIEKPADWAAENAYNVTMDIVGSEDIIGIYAQNDEMPIGIVSALKELGKLIPAGTEGHIPLVAIDGTPSALQRIRDGFQDGTVTQDPVTVGAVAMENAYKAAKGEAVDASFETVPELINKDNVDDAKFWGNAYAK